MAATFFMDSKFDYTNLDKNMRIVDRIDRSLDRIYKIFRIDRIIRERAFVFRGDWRKLFVE